ncbi:MAG: hypothetical protein DRQ49_10465 [Gammaproteobacteria bacterium]|nr:MAG: hypothetical protein DRQ49_10465 [Gammaproteobacteria bacterium]
MRFKSQLLSTIMLLVFFTAPASVLAEPFFFPPMECPTFINEVNITDIKDFYKVGDKLDIGVHVAFDSDSSYKQVNLWIVISMPGGLLYMTGDMISPFSPTPIAFRESVERLKDDYVVFSNFEIPGGLGGDYVIFAFFTKEKVKDLDNVFMAIVSNIASANFTISNNW